MTKKDQPALTHYQYWDGQAWVRVSDGREIMAAPTKFRYVRIVTKKEHDAMIKAEND